MYCKNCAFWACFGFKNPYGPGCNQCLQAGAAAAVVKGVGSRQIRQSTGGFGPMQLVDDRYVLPQSEDTSEVLRTTFQNRSIPHLQKGVAAKSSIYLIFLIW